LRALQAKVVPDAIFHDDVTTLPSAPLFLIANEFFDALPIRQFQRSGATWRERVLGPDLTLGLADPAEVPQLAHRLADTSDGQVVEICPALPPIITEIDSRIAAHGGAALIIDYGDWDSLGDTLQAMQNHAPVDPFSTPGNADLTAHVDFAAIAAQITQSQFSRVTPQGIFLERLGITQRAQAFQSDRDHATTRTPTARIDRMTLEVITDNTLDGVQHGFFTRKGGSSSGVFAGLNCGFGSSDQHEIVAINRDRVAQAMGGGHLCAVHQHHSADVIVLEKATDTPPKADALVTKTPGLVLSVLTADCQPVLFADMEAGILASDLTK